MSSNILETLKTLRQNLHNVGSLNNWGKAIINQGAKVVTAPIDNFELVELGFDAQTGERTCKSLSDSAKKGYLIATPEEYMDQYETISAFFNGVGEMARIVILESGRRFECSNVEFEDKNNLATKPLKNGQLVHYDHSKKKFMISNSTANGMSGYSAAANKFYLVDKDCVSLDGQQVYRFEVQ